MVLFPDSPAPAGKKWKVNNNNMFFREKYSCQKPNKANWGHFRGHNRSTLTQLACKKKRVQPVQTELCQHSAISLQLRYAWARARLHGQNVEIEIKTNLQNALQRDQDCTHDTVSPVSHAGNLKAGLIFALEALLNTKTTELLRGSRGHQTAASCTGAKETGGRFILAEHFYWVTSTLCTHGTVL